ncbi:hypothetical protein [Streptomyces koyangensis]|nr:hypothetical protein OH717_15450 [Streptomyces albidoflavus]
MRSLTSHGYTDHHWLVISAMISGSPDSPLAWACLVTLGTALSLWLRR